MNIIFPDNSLLLMPNLKLLSANENQLTKVGDLTGLPHLTHLYLSANRLSDVDNLHLFLGNNIVHLDLSQNHVSSLRGFSALVSLHGLDLGSNIVADISEVQYIQSLEKLDYLVLTGNPVATVVDYRIKVRKPKHFWWNHVTSRTWFIVLLWILVLLINCNKFSVMELSEEGTELFKKGYKNHLVNYSI